MNILSPAGAYGRSTSRQLTFAQLQPPDRLFALLEDRLAASVP